jgi:hypothetical protein
VGRSSGFRYQTDRAAEQYSPTQGVNEWALRHPVVDATASVFLAAFFAVLFTISMNSYWGIAVGVAVAGAARLMAWQNYRRRSRNGTAVRSRTGDQPDASSRVNTGTGG